MIQQVMQVGTISSHMEPLAAKIRNDKAFKKFLVNCVASGDLELENAKRKAVIANNRMLEAQNKIMRLAGV